MGTHGIINIHDLKVYNLSFDLAVEIFQLTRSFPREELYSLTDQIRRSSRSIPANISEGFAKRHYESVFKQHLASAVGSLEETKTWLELARSCAYIDQEQFNSFIDRYKNLGGMLYRLMQNWKSKR